MAALGVQSHANGFEWNFSDW